MEDGSILPGSSLEPFLELGRPEDIDKSSVVVENQEFVLLLDALARFVHLKLFWPGLGLASLGYLYARINRGFATTIEFQPIGSHNNIYFQNSESLDLNIIFLLGMTNMPAFSRGLRPFLRTDYICSKSTNFSTTSVVSSGHNRWSKIKHDKGAVDAKKTKARSIIAHDIALAVKCVFSGTNFP